MKLSEEAIAQLVNDLEKAKSYEVRQPTDNGQGWSTQKDSKIIS
jgi:hypothetical protein